MASLDEVLAKLSKRTIVTLALIGGVAFIVISDPPHTLCDSQLEAFTKSQKGFLLINPDRPGEKTPLFKRLVEQCKAANSPGGCYELFLQMRGMLAKSKTVSVKCTKQLGETALFKNTVLGVAGLMMKLAWGDKPPLSYYEKFGWLDNADIALFCELKTRAGNTIGGQVWNDFVSTTMVALPGAETMNRDKIWGLSLASANCNKYM
jgi:hypothetical protein